MTFAALRGNRTVPLARYMAEAVVIVVVDIIVFVVLVVAIVIVVVVLVDVIFSQKVVVEVESLFM